jgi:hypothetical protein
MEAMAASYPDAIETTVEARLKIKASTTNYGNKSVHLFSRDVFPLPPHPFFH